VACGVGGRPGACAAVLVCEAADVLAVDAQLAALHSKQPALSILPVHCFKCLCPFC
jgi:hypothetical protein